MSVIFHAHGHVVYESQAALDAVVSELRRTNRMNGDLQWTDGSGEPFRLTNETAIHRDWHGLTVPRARTHRNFDPTMLLEGAFWARICATAFNTGPTTQVYDADGVRRTVDLDEWAQEELGYDEGTYESRAVADEFHDQCNTDPPAEVKEAVQNRSPGEQTDFSEW